MGRGSRSARQRSAIVAELPSNCSDPNPSIGFSSRALVFPTPQNQNKKAHKNGIHKPKFHRFVSLKQVRTITDEWPLPD